jgi:hypothetical protein
MADPQVVTSSVTQLQLWGAGCFGAIIGWYVYYINRYRKGDVQLSDVVTLIGIIGGGAIQALFKPDGALFGAYGVGLAVGFYSYFVILIFLVGISKNFDVDYFLDGRRKNVAADSFIPDTVRQSVSAMDAGAERKSNIV